MCSPHTIQSCTLILLSVHVCYIYSLSTQEHNVSAKEIRKLLCEFINSILTDLDSGEESTLNIFAFNSVCCLHCIH